MNQHAPEPVFLPFGHDQKGGHRNIYELFSGIVEFGRLLLPGLMNRDPKTVPMRIDAAMPHDERTAAGKTVLLRCHGSQQQRRISAFSAAALTSVSSLWIDAAPPSST
ncbi:MAG: hypothetical protein PHQ04_02385 [Opitutaceae bacterium]|nr:hypothetical protein [Opitutaceae bacterium]